MNVLICPLCANQANIHNHNTTLKEIIYKHLHITLKEVYVKNICLKCEEILILWDGFAQKCLETQSFLEENIDPRVHLTECVKVEGDPGCVEVKVENAPVNNIDDDFNDNDDKYSLSQYDFKDGDDPLSDVKIKDESYSDNEKKKKKIRKKKKRNNNRVELDECIYFSFDCYICEAKLRNWTLLKSHCSKVHSVHAKVLCVCGKYLHSSSMIQHHKRKHGENEDHIDIKPECLLLNTESEDDNVWFDNESANSSKRSYTRSDSIVDFVCHVCQEKFGSWKTLHAHTIEDHSMKPKVLCVCGRYLNSKTAVYQHREAHRNNSPGLMCDNCDKHFLDKRGLMEHMKSHIPKDEYAFNCHQCPKKFPTPNSLKLHMKTHNRTHHSCDICGLKLATKNGVKIHKIALHDKVKDYICDICGKACTAKGALKDHKVTHTEDRKFQCEKCDKCFKQSYVLKRHIEAQHTGIVYKCPQCPVVLKSRNGLWAHKTVHTDVYKYCCKLCDRKFKRNDKLKTHMNSHDGVKPFTCRLCGKVFSNNQNLKMHTQRAHPSSLNIYNNLCKDELESTYSEHTETSVGDLHSHIRLNM